MAIAPKKGEYEIYPDRRYFYRIPCSVNGVDGAA